MRKAKFEHVNIVVSIIIGLTITKLLEISILLLDQNMFHIVDWIQIIWIFNMLLAQIQFWWSINRYSADDSNFWQYVGLLVSPILMFLMSQLILPKEIIDSKKTLDFFIGNSTAFFLLAVFTMIVNLIESTRKPYGTKRYYIQISLTVLLLSGALVPNPNFQLIIGLLTSFAILLITFTRQND